MERYRLDRQPSTGCRGCHRTAPAQHRPAPKVPLLGTRAYAMRQSQELADTLAENQRLRAQLASTGGLEIAELQRLCEQYAAQVAAEQARLDHLQTQVVKTQEEQMLQEIGIYEYRHPLSDVVTYLAELKAAAR